MKSAGITSKLGIGTGIDELLQGRAPNALASKLGTSTETVQQFIDGKVSAAMATALGCDLSGAQELRDLLGREGAIGFLVGLRLGHAQRE